MKQLHIKIIFGIALISTTLFVACTDILDEVPRKDYTPDYFATENGVMGGLTALYAHTRDFFGNGYFYSGMQSGTDEQTYGKLNNGSSKAADFSGAGTLTPGENPYGGIWAVFPYINTANGIIENAEAVGTISEDLIAEARFWRAWDYFMLVQTYGGVPLDLGAGELKFNDNPSRFSVRNTVPEVYTKCIFKDLNIAVNNLLDAPRQTGTVTKTVARLYLAKAYLTYGWWLENPNEVPTYPTTDRVDLDGHDASWYFQEAYNVAMAAIEDPNCPYQLMDYFYDVNEGSNDHNMEWLLYADHTEESSLYNGAPVSGWGSGSSPGNFSGWFASWNYTEIRSSASESEFEAISSVGRESVQAHGRPWTAVAPIQEAITTTFADKTNDSRYDGTFATVYRGNWQRNGNDAEFVYNANLLPVGMDEPILTFLGEEDPNVVYPGEAGQNGVGAGVLPGRSDWVVTPSAISRCMFPNIWKIGPYRTDNGNTLGQPNVTTTRPVPIAKFPELYFIAAEAAVKGATTTAGNTAYDLINVIRARAGKWRWDNNGKTEKFADYSAEMTAATPTEITIDYILDERSREFFGEGQRWFELARTQTWEERAASYTICGTEKGDVTPVTYERSIPKTAYLRPIPSGQFNSMEMTDAQKAEYQNPGY